MKRALRVDKIRLAALEATLRLYRDPARLRERLPTMRLLARPKAEIEATARQLVSVVERAVAPAFQVAVIACESQIGSGALPLFTIPSAGLALTPGSGRMLAELAAALRRLPIPVIGRIERGSLILDLRCLEDMEGFEANLAHLAPPGEGGGDDEPS